MNIEQVKSRFLELQLKAPSIQNVCMEFGGENYKVPDQIGSEFQTFIEYYQSLNAKTVLEVGTWQGGSLWYLVKYAAPGATVVTVDLDHSVCQFWSEYTALRPDVNLIKITGPSQDPATVEKVFNITDKYDFVFIDGWHSSPIVDLDWANYGRKASVCAMHDIGWGSNLDEPQDVRKVWNSIVAEYGPSTATLIHQEYTHATYGIGIVKL